MCRCEKKREEGVSRRHSEHGVLEEVEKLRRVRALWSLCRCERKREEGVSRRHGDHGGERKEESGLCAVVYVSL